MLDPRDFGCRCDSCPLKGNTVVWPEKAANDKPKLILVGEGPGKKEEIVGRPFVGVSGSLLDQTLSLVGLKRSECHITNATLCVEGQTLVRMAFGKPRRIIDLVREKSTETVLAVDPESGDIVERPITGWHETERLGRSTYYVTHEFAKAAGPNGKVRALVTEDHEILTASGWVQAHSVNGRMIATGDFSPGPMAEQLVLGTLLGDGTIPKKANHLVVTHAVAQSEYLRAKAHLLGRPFVRVPGRNGWQAKEKTTSRASAYYRKLRGLFYPKGKKIIPAEVIRDASDFTIAVWYMDDGYFDKTRVESLYAEICVAGFSWVDAKRAAECLSYKGFECRVVTYGGVKRIAFSPEGTRELSRRIAKYVPECLQYKLAKEDRGKFDASTYRFEGMRPFYAKAEAKKVSTPAYKYVYCLDVKGARNFITTAAVVHNCRGDTDKEVEQAAKACAPRLLREAGAYDAPLVVMGKAAATSILGVKSIQLTRGFVWTAAGKEKQVHDAELAVSRFAKRVSKGQATEGQVQKAKARLEDVGLLHALAGRKVFPTVHPAFVLRADHWRPIFELDMKRAARWVREELTENKLDSTIHRQASPGWESGTWGAGADPEAIRDWLSAMDHGDIVLDIETTITPSVLTSDIVCYGISDGVTGFVIDPWQPEIHAPILNEFIASVVARGDNVGGHNFLNFDMLASVRDGVVFPRQPFDTIIAFHAYASHFPLKLDQLVSTYCNSVPWKIVFGRRGGSVASEKGGLPPADMDPEERDYYCVLDCFLTKKAWVRMQGDLEPERAVYEHDLRMAEMTGEMQVTGVGVDLQKLEALKVKLRRRRAALKGQMRTLLNWPDFNPRQHAHVSKALYGILEARVIERTKGGLPATSESVLEALAPQKTKAGKFCRLLMTYRLVDKVKGTYVDYLG